MTEAEYRDLISLVETAHGVRLSPAQIDQLNARLDDEELFFPLMPFDQAVRLEDAKKQVILRLLKMHNY